MGQLRGSMLRHRLPWQAGSYSRQERFPVPMSLGGKDPPRRAKQVAYSSRALAACRDVLGLSWCGLIGLHPSFLVIPLSSVT